MRFCLIKSSCARILSKPAVCNVSLTIQQRLLNISCQVEQLTSRGLIRVSGNDTASFLQGIVTNDMRHFEDGCKSVFTMFLNTKGRVLFDSIIYKTKEENTFFVECDSKIIQDLVRHLNMYRVRRKIDINLMDNDLKLWVLFNPKEVEHSATSDITNSKQEQVVPCTVPKFDDKRENSNFTDLILSANMTIYSDPRLSTLGCRVIAPSNEDVVEAVRNANILAETSSSWSYRSFRYRLGVGEGIDELPIGKCFPLEANCDYLHGVSFHKGCYIGQEVTARTHHTGVVRKRLMPLVLHSDAVVEHLPVDTPINGVAGDKNVVIGKLRGIEKDCALGLMRIAEALEVNCLKIKNIEGETVKPFWWPKDLPKERMDSGSSRKN